VEYEITDSQSATSLHLFRQCQRGLCVGIARGARKVGQVRHVDHHRFRLDVARSELALEKSNILWIKRFGRPASRISAKDLKCGAFYLLRVFHRIGYPSGDRYVKSDAYWHI
jgi:hypothetical protein